MLFRLSLSYLARMARSRPGSETPAGWKNKPLITLKMAVFAAMPSAKVSTATMVNPGVLPSRRMPNLHSCKNMRFILGRTSQPVDRARCCPSQNPSNSFILNMFYLFLGLLSVRLRTAVCGNERQPEIDVLTQELYLQLLQQANLALDLSQTRYKLALASIVELSQAQLQQTQALIGSAQAILPVPFGAGSAELSDR